MYTEKNDADQSALMTGMGLKIDLSAPPAEMMAAGICQRAVLSLNVLVLINPWSWEERATPPRSFVKCFPSEITPLQQFSIDLQTFI
ncbi:hypothetical protein Nepgr_004749 [Nepenthes gracilis]|uniref:Uncharacterized protein n=1 Tax=Nepenthes gracilis TaxID=150966 RepID=A0AAD3XFM3_NEPGR|nr:hypothetical protein Nepgr_004749 [Nepenthes gracilis]